MTESNPFFDYITSSSISLVASGNAGISPFLTLLVLGCVEMYNPELLNMGNTMETALSSWWSIAILGVLTLGEMIGKCIPAIDELIDSAEVFVVPIISILASLATMGLLPGAKDNTADDGMGQTVDVAGMFGQDEFDVYDNKEDLMGAIGGLFNGGNRLLEDTTGGGAIVTDDNIIASDLNDFGEGFMTFTKICLVVFGVCLSLLIHFFKMILRASSLVCTGGCCQPCITITEFLLVIFGVIFALIAPIFAVIAAGALLCAAAYTIYRRCCKTTSDDDDDDGGFMGKMKKKKKKSASSNDKYDIENAARRSTATTVPRVEGEVIDAECTGVLPPAMAPNGKGGKPDAEATVY